MTMPPNPQNQPEPNSNQAGGGRADKSEPDAPLPPSELLSVQVVESIKGLGTLLEMVLGDHGARTEAARAMENLVEGLIGLGGYIAKDAGTGADLKFAWDRLTSELSELVSGEETEEEIELEDEEDLPDNELARRLGMTLPPHLRQASHQEAERSGKEPTGPDVRRVVIGSLEPTEEVAVQVNQAAASFPRDNWSVTNLGSNVPIMALTGTIMEVRPSVIVLVVGYGRFVAETTRLVADLKRQLFGIKIVTLGPALVQPSLVERLRSDLSGTDATKAGELADQLFNPLNRLGDRLRLSIEVEEIPGSQTDEGDDQNSKEAEG